MLDLENFEEKFKSILESSDWKLLEEKFINATNVLLIGNGGNLAIADHAAIDISRLTDKNGISPGSGITSTSIIGDKDAKSWFKTWVEYRMRGLDPSKTMVIAFSCSTTGTSSEASMMALEYASSLGVDLEDGRLGSRLLPGRAIDISIDLEAAEGRSPRSKYSEGFDDARKDAYLRDQGCRSRVVA